MQIKADRDLLFLESNKMVTRKRSKKWRDRDDQIKEIWSELKNREISHIEALVELSEINILKDGQMECLVEREQQAIADGKRFINN